MNHRITQAQPPLDFIEPRYNPLVLRLGQWVLPVWLRWRLGVVRTELVNPEPLIELFHQFQQGKVRFMLAFRHPSTVDPLCVSQVVWNQMPAIARQRSVPLRSPLHIHFIYDRGIPLWAGKAVGWLMAQLGGTPIRRGSLDTVGLRSIRELFANGSFPMAAAPEGGTNGHNEIVSPIEPGLAQFGFWCVDDLQKAGRSEAVAILPMGIQYRFVTAPWKRLSDLMTQLESDSGLSSPPDPDGLMACLEDGVAPSPEQEALLYQRLIALGEQLLNRMEGFYQTYHGQTLESVSHTQNGEAGPIGDRLQALLNAAIDVAEQAFALKPKGSLTDRCRRIEQAAWDRIYRADLKAAEALSTLDRGLADWVAEDASLRLWHMRLVETFVSVTGRYVAERPNIERFADTTLLIWKVLRQISRQPANPQPDLGPRIAHVTLGAPISISDREEDYRQNRRRAIAQVTQELQGALEGLIE